jgi:hypothetical protein
VQQQEKEREKATTARNLRYVEEAGEIFCAQFTCFTRRKVHILTPEVRRQAAKGKGGKCASSSSIPHIETSARARAAAPQDDEAEHQDDDTEPLKVLLVAGS